MRIAIAAAVDGVQQMFTGLVPSVADRKKEKRLSGLFMSRSMNNLSRLFSSLLLDFSTELKRMTNDLLKSYKILTQQDRLESGRMFPRSASVKLRLTISGYGIELFRTKIQRHFRVTMTSVYASD